MISLDHNLLPFFLFTAINFPIALEIITISFLITGKASISEKALVVSLTARSIKLFLHISLPLLKFKAKNSQFEYGTITMLSSTATLGLSIKVVLLNIP